jgi:hypothetical protein
LLLELYEIKACKTKNEFLEYFYEKFRGSIANAHEVLGDGLKTVNEADQIDIIMAMTKDNLKKCIEGDMDGCNEIDTKAFPSSVKLDCYIQCNRTFNIPITVCRKCWTKANHFTKYMLDHAVSRIKQCGSDRPNSHMVDLYDDESYHDLSRQQTLDLFLGVEGIGQLQGYYSSTLFSHLFCPGIKLLVLYCICAYTC